jgi:hypothetical protein
MIQKMEQIVGKSAKFHYLPTDKFTTDYFSIHFVHIVHGFAKLHTQQRM